MLAGKKILLIISGGIAAYKCHDLIRQIKKAGGRVQVVLTRAGEEFVTPLSLGSLSGEKVMTDLFNLTDELEIGHIELSRRADLLVVAPACADILAQMTSGRASDLATTLLLATDKPVLVAAAMNVKMWLHPATQRNVRQLGDDGIRFVGPEEGDMACGEYGPGRMSEPSDILAAIEDMLADTGNQPLEGKTVLVTAGPTHEPIDPVRYIANRSSGKQGYAIARAAFDLGARVLLISGPVSEPIPPGVEMIPVETAQEMLNACLDELPVDIAICTAAVADWRVKDVGTEKMKKAGTSDVPDLELTQNPDILHTVATHKTHRPALVVGFAAETENVVEHAREKLKAKGCDLIVANDVSADTGVMGGSRNTVHIVRPQSVEDWPEMSKDAVADRLMALLATL